MLKLVEISSTARSILLLEETIQGFRSDINVLVAKMKETKADLGWVYKVSGAGYDSLLRELKQKTCHLETLLLFLDDVKNIRS